MLGSKVEDSMFELQNPETAINLELDIKTLLSNYEPRISVQTVQVTYPEDSNDLNIRISYNVIGISIPAQTVEFILQPTRV